MAGDDNVPAVSVGQPANCRHSIPVGIAAQLFHQHLLDFLVRLAQPTQAGMLAWRAVFRQAIRYLHIQRVGIVVFPFEGDIGALIEASVRFADLANQIAITIGFHCLHGSGQAAEVDQLVRQALFVLYQILPGFTVLGVAGEQLALASRSAA